MRKTYGTTAAALGVALVAVGLLATPAQSQRANKGSLNSRLAAAGKIKEEQVTAILNELGNVIRDKIMVGEAVELPNLGTFQVTRIPEHRDRHRAADAWREHHHPHPDVVAFGSGEAI